MKGFRGRKKQADIEQVPGMTVNVNSHQSPTPNPRAKAEKKTKHPPPFDGIQAELKTVYDQKDWDAFQGPFLAMRISCLSGFTNGKRQNRDGMSWQTMTILRRCAMTCPGKTGHSA